MEETGHYSVPLPHTHLFQVELKFNKKHLPSPLGFLVFPLMPFQEAILGFFLSTTDTRATSNYAEVGIQEAMSATGDT